MLGNHSRPRVERALPVAANELRGDDMRQQRVSIARQELTG
jgi:hypothetical protein